MVDSRCSELTDSSQRYSCQNAESHFPYNTLFDGKPSSHVTVLLQNDTLAPLHLIKRVTLAAGVVEWFNQSECEQRRHVLVIKAPPPSLRGFLLSYLPSPAPVTMRRLNPQSASWPDESLVLTSKDVSLMRLYVALNPVTTGVTLTEY